MLKSPTVIVAVCLSPVLLGFASCILKSCFKVYIYLNDVLGGLILLPCITFLIISGNVPLTRSNLSCVNRIVRLWFVWYDSSLFNPSMIYTYSGFLLDNM